MLPKLEHVSGPTPSRVLFQISKEGFLMIKNPVVDSGKAIQKRAKEMALTFKKTGTYRKAIGRKTRALKKEGEISATIGINRNSPAIKYAKKVEVRHHIFTRLDHEFRRVVQSNLKKGLSTGLKRLKIKK